MLQHDELFEWRTIYHNVVLGLEIQHMMTARTKQRAHELLDFYGLKQFKNSRPSELSGGMRQRDDIGQILRREQKSAVLVTHDLSEAISLADRVIILSKRPASILQTIPLIFDLQDDTPLNRRNAPEFKTYFQLIWKELNSNE